MFDELEVLALAIARAEDILKYSDDQPRDEHGRWTSSGLGDGGSVIGDGADFKTSRTAIGQIIGDSVFVHDLHEVDPYETDHASHWQREAPATQRFRYNRGNVEWLEAPTDEHYFAVEDYFENNGWRVRQQVMQLDGRLVPPPVPQKQFDPDQPRDDHGRWTDGGAATDFPVVVPPSSGPDVTMQRAALAADRVSKAMLFDPKRVKIIDEDPRQFNVGSGTFTEAAHFDQRDGMVTVNTRTMGTESSDDIAAVVAHEISHAAWQDVVQASIIEHTEISKVAIDKPEEFDRLFKKNGYPREEMRAEIERRWPASSLMARHYFDSYLSAEADTMSIGDRIEGTFNRKIHALKAEDGVSAYSTAYWDESAKSPLTLWVERAVNETLAEVARIQLVPKAHRYLDSKPTDRWVRFATDVRALSRELRRKK